MNRIAIDSTRPEPSSTISRSTRTYGIGRALIGVAVLLLMLSPERVYAQQCAGGREATSATQGRCCWPGQHWDDGFGRCVGPPRCPMSHHAAGDDCVPAERAVAYQPSPHPQGAYVPTLALAAQGHRDVVRRPIWGLVIAGITTFGVGWAAAPIVTAAIGGDGGEIGMMAIPLAGPWVCMAACLDPDDYVAALVINGVIQAAGLTMFILGLAIRTEVQIAAHADGGVHLDIRPWLVPTDAPSAGLTLSVSML